MTTALERNRAKARRGLRDALESLSDSPIHPDDEPSSEFPRDLYSPNHARSGRARFLVTHDDPTIAGLLAQARQRGAHEQPVRTMLAGLVGSGTVADISARLSQELLSESAGLHLPAWEAGHRTALPRQRDLLVSGLVNAPGAPSPARLLMA